MIPSSTTSLFWVKCVNLFLPFFLFLTLQKLDVISNDILKRALRFTGKLGVLASEEEDTPVSFCTALSAFLHT